MHQRFEFLFVTFVTLVWQNHYQRFTKISQSSAFTALLIMMAICAYYAGIMLNALATYCAHNYASIICSSLDIIIVLEVVFIILTNIKSFT